MTVNLQQELEKFKHRIKQDKSVEIKYKLGFTGGGGAITWMLLPLLAVFAYKLIRRSKAYKDYKYYWQFPADPRF